MLRENFDTPDQVLEIYGGTDGKQFCDDLGIEDPEHRDIFRRWFETTSERGAATTGKKSGPGQEATSNSVAGKHVFNGARHLEKVMQIDWSTGELQRYVSTLQENFDSPEQLAQCYSTLSPDGMEVFDAQSFFEDLGIEDPMHRMLFQSWFGTRGTRPAEAKAISEPVPACPLAAEPAKAAPVPMATVATAIPRRLHAERPGLNLGTGTIKAWVWSKDWSVGTLAHYADELEDKFDCPEQIADAYIHGNGKGKVFNGAQFFADVGIEDAAHRGFFSAWFAKEHGAFLKQCA